MGGFKEDYVKKENVNKILENFKIKHSGDNILITGATGFLGGYLVERLLNYGFRHITVIGRNKEKLDKLSKEGLTVIKSDMEDYECINKAVKNKSFVFHIGAKSSPWGEREDFIKSNVIATENFAKAVIAEKYCRMIYVSSPSIYFDGKELFDVKEDYLPDFKKGYLNYYIETKVKAEEILDRYTRDGLEVVTIRPRAIFGVGDESIFPSLIRANKKKFLPMVNRGRILMDVSYVENVVDALILSAVSDESTIGQKYNITNGEKIIFSELIEMVFSSLGVKMNKVNITTRQIEILAILLEKAYSVFNKEPLLTRYTASVLSKSQTLDITKAMEELHYYPRVSVKEGIEIFIGSL